MNPLSRWGVRFYRLALWGVLVAGAGLGHGVARAHSVHVFAYVDGDAIRVEGAFSRNKKVRRGKVAVLDGTSGAVLREGVTDDHGVFRFRPDDAFLATGRGLVIRLDAGEGHRDTWPMSGEDLRALSPALRASTASLSATPPTAGTSPSSEGPWLTEGGGPSNVSASVDDESAAAWDARFERLLEAKIAPLRAALARQEKRGPDLRDVVGGIGWIIGLLGAATYFKYRR